MLKIKYIYKKYKKKSFFFRKTRSGLIRFITFFFVVVKLKVFGFIEILCVLLQRIVCRGALSCFLVKNAIIAKFIKILAIFT